MPENINEQNPVISYNLDKPMSWAEFHCLPEHAQAEYITKLRKKFCCGVGQMAEMFGTTKRDLITKTELLGLNLSGARTARDQEKVLAWEKFLGHEIQEEKLENGCQIDRATEEDVEDIQKDGVLDALEKEIRDLERSPFVRLAMAEEQIRAARLMKRDSLLALEKRGKELVKQGWTFDMMEGWEDG